MQKRKRVDKQGSNHTSRKQPHLVVPLPSLTTSSCQVSSLSAESLPIWITLSRYFPEACSSDPIHGPRAGSTNWKPFIETLHRTPPCPLAIPFEATSHHWIQSHTLLFWDVVRDLYSREWTKQALTNLYSDPDTYYPHSMYALRSDGHLQDKWPDIQAEMERRLRTLQEQRMRAHLELKRNLLLFLVFIGPYCNLHYKQLVIHHQSCMYPITEFDPLPQWRDFLDQSTLDGLAWSISFYCTYRESDALFRRVHLKVHMDNTRRCFYLRSEHMSTHTLWWDLQAYPSSHSAGRAEWAMDHVDRTIRDHETYLTNLEAELEEMRLPLPVAKMCSGYLPGPFDLAARSPAMAEVW